MSFVICDISTLKLAAERFALINNSYILSKYADVQPSLDEMLLLQRSVDSHALWFKNGFERIRDGECQKEFNQLENDYKQCLIQMYQTATEFIS